jgi:hypothetical protein
MIDGLITAALLVLALFLTMWGIGVFVTSVLPNTGRWYVRYLYAAVMLTCAYYLFRLIFDAP